MVQGQVLLKESTGTFPFNFFKVYNFYHDFMKIGHSKLCENEPENIP